MAFNKHNAPPGWVYDYETDTYVKRAEMRITRREVEERMGMNMNDHLSYHQEMMERKQRQMYDEAMRNLHHQQMQQNMMMPYPHDPYSNQLGPQTGGPPEQKPKQKAEKPKHDPLLLLLEEENAA